MKEAYLESISKSPDQVESSETNSHHQINVCQNLLTNSSHLKQKRKNTFLFNSTVTDENVNPFLLPQFPACPIRSPVEKPNSIDRPFKRNAILPPLKTLLIIILKILLIFKKIKMIKKF